MCFVIHLLFLKITLLYLYQYYDNNNYLQIASASYKIIPLVFDVSHCNVISINIALSFFDYHYFFCLSYPPIYYRLLDPYLIIIFSNNVFMMHTSLVKQKPFTTEIKYTKIIFTIISKRQHKKNIKSAQKSFSLYY